VKPLGVVDIVDELAEVRLGIGEGLVVLRANCWRCAGAM
jgi:hypothetical protein